MLLDVLLKKCGERKLLKAKGRQRTDSTHVLAWMRAINRLVDLTLKKKDQKEGLTTFHSSGPMTESQVQLLTLATRCQTFGKEPKGFWDKPTGPYPS